MTKMKRDNELDMELLKLSPALLYEIATDIQVSQKWKHFASIIGFTVESIVMMEITTGDRFPAENVLYHWFSQNPKVIDLINKLIELGLEKPVFRLYKNEVLKDSWPSVLHRLDKAREQQSVPPVESYPCQAESLPQQQQNHTQTPISQLPDYQIPNADPSTSTTDTSGSNTAPYAGPVEVSEHEPSIPRSVNWMKRICSISNNFESDDFDESCPCLSAILSMLEFRSIKFEPSLFDENIEDLKLEQDDEEDRDIGVRFTKEIRNMKFDVLAYSVKKVMDSVLHQRQLYNRIWAQTTYRFHRLPTLCAYSLHRTSILLLLYPEHTLAYVDTVPGKPVDEAWTLFQMLHRDVDLARVPLSASARLALLCNIGEAIVFLHNALPFVGSHGQIWSDHVVIAPTTTGVILTGFDHFYTDHPNFLKGLEASQLSTVKSDGKQNIEKCFQRDLEQFLELICEVWWNVQPSRMTKWRPDQSLLTMAKQENRRPKVNYPGWTEDLNREVSVMVSKTVCFSYIDDNKDNKILHVSEIMDSLQNIRTKSLCITNLPPAYDDLNQMVFTDKRPSPPNSISPASQQQ